VVKRDIIEWSPSSWDEGQKDKRRRIVSNHVLRIFTCDTAIRTALSSSTTRTHASRSLVHVIVVYYLVAQQARARGAFAKDWRGVAPEVATVGSHAVGEGVTWPSRLGSIAKAVPRRGEERVDAQQGGPLCAETVSPAGWAGPGECGVRSRARGSEAGALEGGCASGHGRGECLRAWV
jgi:hypothetical protein